MNKKGFTLVEILSVIVLIGIILAIAIPSSIAISKKSKNQMYDSKVDMIEKAAELYGDDNLDPNDNGITRIKIGDLVKGNYLKKDNKECEDNNCVIDPRSNTAMDEKYVCICNVDKRVVASIDETNDCSASICDPTVKPVNDTKYKITYNSNEGTSCSESYKEVIKGSEWGELCSPTRDGYTFDGWYTDLNNPHTKINSSSKAESNLTVFAKWKNVEYKLIINPNGGSYNNKTSNTEIKQNINTTYNPSNPTRSGYVFTGWSKSGDGSWNGSTYTFTGNGTLTANWRVNTYTLTINPNGGYYNGSTTITQNVNTTYSPSNPTRSGYNFSYWQSSGGSWNGSTFTFTGNGTLTAIWTPITCSYSYYSTNRLWKGTYVCSAGTATLTNCYSKTKTTLCNGGAYGYGSTFSCTASGSYDMHNTCNSSLSSKVVKAGEMPTTESCSCQNITINFDANGGTISNNSEIINVGGVLDPYYQATPRRSDYYFVGWYTSRTGGTKIQNYTRLYSSQTLYAHYEKAEELLDPDEPISGGTSCTKTNSTSKSWSEYDYDCNGTLYHNDRYTATYSCNGTTGEMTSCSIYSEMSGCNSGSDTNDSSTSDCVDAGLSRNISCSC